MRVDLFDFALPDDRIALRPADPREAARLLVVPSDGSLADRTVGDLPRLLRPGDVLVVNDTRVIPARLHGLRRRGEHSARIEALLTERLDPGSWRALARPTKRMTAGDRVIFARDGEEPLDAKVEAVDPGGSIRLRFSCSGAELDAAVARVGVMPLPPYIAGQRPADERDRSDYQTIFADEAGAVAAPTAGLHLTPDLVAGLEAAGIRIVRVTLHVGPGTFLPMRVEDTDEHRMHPEWGRVDPATADALNAARAAGDRIVALGTTSLRLLESAAGPDGTIRPFAAETDIFITPGYRFRAVDLLVTNFHLPRSTLFMLVSAFAGLGRMRDAYTHAIAAGYRFYSYGDACLLERAGP